MNGRMLVVCSLAVLFFGSPAWGQGSPGPRPLSSFAPAPGGRFGSQGTVSLGAERLFGIAYADFSPGSASTTTVSFLGASGSEASFAPYSIPRLAIDYFAGDDLSLGLAAGFSSSSESAGRSSTSVSVVFLNPRVGYALRAADGISVWPRAGISYVSESGGSSSSSFLAATLELQLVFTPLRHFGVAFGPTLDVGLSGSAGSSDVKITQFGLNASLLAWF